LVAGVIAVVVLLYLVVLVAVTMFLRQRRTRDEV
jgi:hypothetical protein